MSRQAAGGVMTVMERAAELALVRRLRAEDVAAFDELYEAFNARLYAFLRRMCRSGDAEDLLEETWIRVVDACARLDPDTRLAPWLFTIARNLYLSYCRSRAREQAYTCDVLSLWPDGLSPSPLQSAISVEFEERLEDAVAALPAKYREAVMLVGVEGLSPGEAAMVCGVAPEAFRQRLSRARALLARTLTERGLLEERCKEEIL